MNKPITMNTASNAIHKNFFLIAQHLLIDFSPFGHLYLCGISLFPAHIQHSLNKLIVIFLGFLLWIENRSIAIKAELSYSFHVSCPLINRLIKRNIRFLTANAAFFKSQTR